MKTQSVVLDVDDRGRISVGKFLEANTVELWLCVQSSNLPGAAKWRKLAMGPTVDGSGH